MRYKPERALTLDVYSNELIASLIVEMRYKPERALTLELEGPLVMEIEYDVEMRYKPERALTLTITVVS